MMRTGSAGRLPFRRATAASTPCAAVVQSVIGSEAVACPAESQRSELARKRPTPADCSNRADLAAACRIILQSPVGPDRTRDDEPFAARVTPGGLHRGAGGPLSTPKPTFVGWCQLSLHRRRLSNVTNGGSRPEAACRPREKRTFANAPFSVMAVTAGSLVDQRRQRPVC